MARPKKHPSNVVAFKPDEAKTLKRAEPFQRRASYFYRQTPPRSQFLIFEYSYYTDPHDLWYANGIIQKDGKPLFQHPEIQKDLIGGKIKLLSWRLESEWHRAQGRY